MSASRSAISLETMHFSVALWINIPEAMPRAVVFHRSRAWTDSGSRGYQLLIEDGRLSASLIHFWPGNAIRIRTVQRSPRKNGIHVCVTYDGSSRADGLAIYADGTRAESEVVRDHLTKTIKGGGTDSLVIGQRFRDRGFKDGLVDEFKVFNRALTDIEVREVYGSASIQEQVVWSRPSTTKLCSTTSLRPRTSTSGLRGRSWQDYAISAAN